MNKPDEPTGTVEQPAAWLVEWDGVGGTAGRAFVKRENAVEFVARCCYPDNRVISPLYGRPQHLLCANGVQVERVARHLEQAVHFIDTVYADAKTLDRGPILSNMRRWSRLLREALDSQADIAAVPAEHVPLKSGHVVPSVNDPGSVDVQVRIPAALVDAFVAEATARGVTVNTVMRERLATSPVDAPSNVDALGLIAAERQRQVAGEGFTPSRDDTYRDGQLAYAAAAYALPEEAREYGANFTPAHWPWSALRWRPGDRIRELVKAGALIVAEIERQQRERDRPVAVHDIEAFQIVRSGTSVQLIDGEGRTSGPLNMGECLEQVVGLLFPEVRKVYPMRSVEEWTGHGVTLQTPARHSNGAA